MVAAIAINARQNEFLKLTGPYLGQKPPGELPEAFASSIIFCENAVHGNIAFSPDGKEIYWIFLPPDYGQNPPPIQFIKQANGEWTKPKILEFSKEYGVMNISMAPDGKKLFFTSKRPWPASWGRQPAGNTLEAYKTWYIERSSAGWGDQKPLDRRINQNLMGVSSTNDGTLYTHGIKRIRVKNGQYTEWEQLGPPLNVGRIRGGNPFISPDESYILFNGRWPGRFGYGIFISYRTGDDEWTEPINLLEKINAPRGGSQPVVTPDGKYLFYYSEGKFYWMDAGIIEDLKPTGSIHS
jgi:Tol biopolymer transport system component